MYAGSHLSACTRADWLSLNICACGGPTLTLGIFPNCSSPYSLRQGLSTKPGGILTVLVQLVSVFLSCSKEGFCLCLPRFELQVGCHTYLVCSGSSRHLNSNPLNHWPVSPSPKATFYMILLIIHFGNGKNYKEKIGQYMAAHACEEAEADGLFLRLRLAWAR